MNLLAKVGGGLALIGAGSYLAYGYVTHAPNLDFPVVKSVLAKFKGEPSEEVESPSEEGESTPLRANTLSGREKLWAEAAAFRQADEQKQAQHRARIRAAQTRAAATNRVVKTKAKKRCRTRRS